MNAIVENFKVDQLDDADLKVRVPSAFADRPMTGLSHRYTFLSTTAILAGLREKSWVPVHAEEQRVRTAARIGFQKHLIRFRLSDQLRSLDEWNVELVLTNSHDAGCAYILQVGVFRRICSNGLVVSDSQFEAIRFRHSRVEASHIVEASYRIMDHVPRVGSVIGAFRRRQLSHEEAIDFSTRSLILRYHSLDESPITPPSLLKSRRPEDDATDMWTVYNKVQENLVRGGLSDHKLDRNGRLRTLHGLRGIDSRLSLNQRLWGLAESVLTSRN